MAGHWLAATALAVSMTAPQGVGSVRQDRDAAMELGRKRAVVAVRIDEPIELDGRMDEAAWERAEPARDFIQGEPEFGLPATERTEVRLLYDDDNLYVGARCFDSKGGDGATVNDLRKDFSTRDGDVFEIVLDTFDDDRNGFLFGANPEGARFDGQFGGEGESFNRDWDGAWTTRTSRGPHGWQVEMVIPFRTLRFSGADEQVWGVNFLRRIRRKNEDTYWAPIPTPFRITKVSLAGKLHGIRGVRHGRNLVFKPYLAAPLSRSENDDTDFQPDAGIDVKYGVTSQLTLDLTVNTDFSQVEADEEQVNLTRFDLFFPEKREFFLENSSIFAFGDRGDRPDLVPFFSRRIGITEDGDLVPILGGARLTGRSGAYTLGLLNMQTGELDPEPSTNFSVVRVRRDIFSRSDVGGIFINKQEGGGDSNRTFGFDSNFNFGDYLNLQGYVLKTDSPGAGSGETAAQAALEWDDGVWDLRASYLTVGDEFNPEVGFVRRTGIRASSGRVQWTPRPGEALPSIRRLGPSISIDHITNQQGELETREVEARFEIDFQNGSELSFDQEFNFERLEEPFEIRDGQFIQVGDYPFREFGVSFSSDRSRLLSGNARFSHGGFYDGDRSSYRLGVRYQPGFRLSADVSWSRNDIELPSGDFITDLVSARTAYSFSTRLFLNALIQYNSQDEEIVSNIRFNFNYRPLNDFFLVYNERRSTGGEVIERALIAKLTYTFSF